MKKAFKTILLLLLITLKIDVLACGEINNLKSDIGSVTKVNSTNYVVSIPEGTTEVTLSADTKYTWVKGYEPRKVSTLEKAELQVDGEACGYGIYTYFIKFKTVAPVIAELEQTPTTTTAPANTTTPAETPSTEIVENPTVTEPVPLVKLETLTIANYELEFNKDKPTYKLTVSEDTTSLDITATPEVLGNAITISENSKNLVDGDNEIIINVTDINGVIGTYKIIVTKPKKLSNNNYLASLIIEEYPLSFEPSTTTYNIEVQKTNSLYIKAIPENSEAKCEILNNNNLKKNSTVIIRVTAENGDIRDYTLNITFKSNLSEYWRYIVSGVLVVLLIVFLIISKKSREKKNKPEGLSTIEAVPETAGSIAVQPVQEVSPVEAPIVTPSQPSTLQMVEPTIVEPAIPVTPAIETPAAPIQVAENVAPIEPTAVAPTEPVVLEQTPAAPVPSAEPSTPVENPGENNEVFHL